MFIERPDLMNHLEKYRGRNLVKVLTGVRRCGKSTLLMEFARRLVESGVPQQNMFIRRLDEFQYLFDYSARDLHQEISHAMAGKAAGPFYVFLDEVQEVDGWERIVRGLEATDGVDIYITGSNAYLLSSELATLLTGRYISIHVQPLSFVEVATHFQSSTPSHSLEELFLGYMRYGGMPAIYEQGAPDGTTWAETLTDIYESVVNRDIAARSQIRDKAALGRLCQYLFSTSGSLVNATKVANALKQDNASISRNTVEQWMETMSDAFLLYAAPQERLRGKALLNPNRKWYPVDNGFRNLATGNPASDRGAQLEGIVFMELIRRGYAVTVGDLGEPRDSGSEIDFVARLGTKQLYIQVTLDMLDDRVRTRELKPLQALTDAHERLVLTLNRLDTGMTEEGIRIEYIPEWLMNR